MKGVLGEEPMEQGEMEPGEMGEREEGGEDSDDGGYTPEADDAVAAAITEVQKRLYEGDIADGIAEALSQASDPVQGLVDQASTLIGVAEDIVGDSVPDEGYIMFGIALMGEVVEIAQAAGIQVGGREIAEALRKFILQVVQELGGDTSQIEAAMGQIDTAQLGAAMDQEIMS